jgi:UDP-N-acetylmuramoyl-L-alanyl-D-glutamate--2,6-diaminopimelate ligase
MNQLLDRLATLGVTPSTITADSRRVVPGSLFLACPGERVDGRQFIAQAVAQGAAAVAWESDGFDWNSQWQVPNLPVTGLRGQLGVIAGAFYGQPSQQLWMIGITGTNGKTSCSHWLADALTRLQRKTAAIGTLGNGFPGALSATINTTPDPIELQRMLADYRAQGASGVAMEVSSHGLEQGRVSGVHFDVAMFTNLTRDHLDYHGNMFAYAQAKKQLFYWPGLRCAVLNVDDEMGAQLAEELAGTSVQVLTYGLEAGMVRGCELRLDAQGLAMRVHTPQGEAQLQVPLLGRFNAYNLLAVLAALLASGVALADALDALRQVAAVPGRMQRFGGGGKPLVVVDYAHTPDALDKVLVALREQTRGRLLCVFGCGGNRDKGKRPLMGEVASRLSDSVYVTSDNPRNEDQAQIIAEIVEGMSANYHVEADRAAAITRAIQDARPEDVVLLAGKGHELYQEIAGTRLPFSDAEVAQRILEELQ